MRKDRNILCIFAEYMSMKFTLQHKDPSSHARAGFVAHVAVENALDRRRRAYGHENRGAYDAVVGRQFACAGFGRRILML